MKNIDFLPDVYRYRRALRHSRLCWMAVGVLFSLGVAGAASVQWCFRAALAAELLAIEPQHAISQQRELELSQLKEIVARTDELAALYLYLEYPWPRTQLLAAVAGPLPKSIQLTDVHVVEQAELRPESRGADVDTQHVAEDQKEEKTTAKTVLARLQGAHDHLPTILEVSGEAASDKEVHEYVEALAKTSLVESASLKSLESAPEATSKRLSRFHIRVIVKKGYGQPGAPSSKEGPGSVAAVGTAGNTAQLAGGSR